ncbi:MAG: hypothetical protein ABIT37_05015 [Luteolibacter sp.]
MKSYPSSGINPRSNPYHLKAIACSCIILAGLCSQTAHALTGTVNGDSSDGQANKASLIAKGVPVVV